MFRRPIFQITPIILSTSSKKHVFWWTFGFQGDFCILGQQVLTKLFTWKESPNFILQDPSFEFCISYVVPEIFLFFGWDTCIPDLKRTTFTYQLWAVTKSCVKKVFHCFQKFPNPLNSFISSKLLSFWNEI